MLRPDFISVRKWSHFGQVVFQKQALIDHGIVSPKGLGGKRGFRIYPPWDKAENKQAKATQKWQLPYFLPISSDGILAQKIYLN